MPTSAPASTPASTSAPTSAPTPAEIVDRFVAHWSGSREALDDAMAALMADLRSSYALAGASDAVLTTVDDYCANQYF